MHTPPADFSTRATTSAASFRRSSFTGTRLAMMVAIEADALASVEKAEQVAPTVRRPRSAFDAARREVELGDRISGKRVVETGLKENDRAIVNGMQRAREGSEVKPVEEKPASTE